jgi:hypothetical protein
MGEPDDDLRATIADVHEDALELASIEAEKALLEPTDPKVVELSHEAEGAARRIRAKTVAQRELAEEIAGQA